MRDCEEDEDAFESWGTCARAESDSDLTGPNAGISNDLYEGENHDSMAYVIVGVLKGRRRGAVDQDALKIMLTVDLVAHAEFECEQFEERFMLDDVV